MLDVVVHLAVAHEDELAPAAVRVVGEVAAE
jgi:hypothetical protein